MKTYEYILKVDNWSSKKFLILSDFLLENKNDIRKLANLQMFLLNKMRKKEKYDAIIILGNLVNSTNVLRFDNFVTENLVVFMEFLGRMAPTFIAYGNHDISFSIESENGKDVSYCPDERTFKQRLIEKILNYRGINILENETRSLGGNYTISVLNPYVYDPRDINTVLNRNDFNFLKRLNSDDVNTVVCHYPNILRYLNKIGYLNNADVCIAANNSGLKKFMEIKDNWKDKEQVVVDSEQNGFGYTKIGNTQLIINPAISPSSVPKNLTDNPLEYAAATEMTLEPSEAASRARRLY